MCVCVFGANIFPEARLNNASSLVGLRDGLVQPFEMRAENLHNEQLQRRLFQDYIKSSSFWTNLTAIMYDGIVHSCNRRNWEKGQNATDLMRKNNEDLKKFY